MTTLPLAPLPAAPLLSGSAPAASFVAPQSRIVATDRTTFLVGTYDGASDTFTRAVDLNDRVSYWLVSADLAQPQKVYARSSTIRSPGERIVNWNYQNRHVKLTINLLYGAGADALLDSIHALLAAIENPPYRIAFAAPNTTALTYADVVAVTHSIPYDAKLILNGAVRKIVIDFECLPGFSGDRVYLSNLASNPGFEAAAGAGITVFDDDLNTSNAYTLVAGSAPSVASNVMTLPDGCTLTFGSPVWGPINTWRVRFQWVTNSNPIWYLHYTDANNTLRATLSSAGVFALRQTVAGTSNLLASSTVSLTHGNWYWVKLTQYPVETGYAPAVQATLYDDASGAIGAQVSGGAIGPVAAADATAATSGKAGLAASGASLPIGGAFDEVQHLSLFGPGAWSCESVTSGGVASGVASGAWEQTAANTYAGGPATSYGAARLDLPPAGTVDANWRLYGGGSPTGSDTAMPVQAAGDTLAAAVWVRASGLATTTALQLQVNEYDSGGTLLRQTVIAEARGNQTTWLQLASTLVTGAGAAYAGLRLRVVETTAGASASGVVWFDNAQCWNVTRTQAAMPYCELRFPQSPAQLTLSGLAGDLPTGLATAMGFTPLFSATAPYLWYLGIRAAAQPGAKLVYPALYALAPNGAASASSALRGDAYGGMVTSWAVADNPGVTVGATNILKDLAGSYQAFVRTLPGDTTYASQTARIHGREVAGTTPDFSNLNVIGSWLGTQYPVGASAAQWTWANAGAVTWPLAPQLLTEDLAAKMGYASFDVYGVSGTWEIGEAALIPIDGDTLQASITVNFGDPQWTWIYNTPSAPETQSAGWRASCRAASSAPNISDAGGGTVSTDSQIGLSAVGSSYLRVDPTQKSGADGSAIAQLVSLIYDKTAGTNYGAVYEFSYTPQYLFPRQG